MDVCSGGKSLQCKIYLLETNRWAELLIHQVQHMDEANQMSK